MEKVIEQLVEDYGLETLLLQNDIEQAHVLELLIEKGLIDLDDYIFLDVDNTAGDFDYA